jgi:ABC-type spermidine/putrescine transport system permease subunit II
MDEVVGGFFAVAMAVVVVAAIYQLNKKGSPIVPAAQGLGTTTLTSIFK